MKELTRSVAPDLQRRYNQSIVKHDIIHGLDRPTAQTVARKAAESYASRFANFDLQCTWVTEDKLELLFAVGGKKLNGTLCVLDDVFRFEIKVPMLFQMFSGKAKEILDRETQKWIDKAKRGELEDTPAEPQPS